MKSKIKNKVYIIFKNNQSEEIFSQNSKKLHTKPSLLYKLYKRQLISQRFRRYVMRLIREQIHFGFSDNEKFCQ